MLDSISLTSTTSDVEGCVFVDYCFTLRNATYVMCDFTCRVDVHYLIYRIVGIWRGWSDITDVKT